MNGDEMDDEAYQREADVLGDPGREIGRIPGANTRERVAGLVRRNREDLDRLGQAYRLHQEHADCPGDQNCIGTAALDWIEARMRDNPAYAVGMLAVATAELAQARAVVAAAQQEVADIGARALRLDLDLIDVSGQLSDANERLDRMLDQLRACDEFPADAAVELED